MGANQSSTNGRDDRDGPSADGSTSVVKTCYYELLDVDRQATDEE